jgi:hypothetical protein
MPSHARVTGELTRDEWDELADAFYWKALRFTPYRRTWWRRDIVFKLTDLRALITQVMLDTSLTDTGPPGVLSLKDWTEQ